MNDLRVHYVLVRGSQSIHPLQSIFFYIVSYFSSDPVTLMLGQVLCMFFGLPLYSDSSFTIWALSMYQWPMTIPELTLKGSVLFLVSSCYFCCKIWKPVYLMINDLCLVYYIFIQDCFILPCAIVPALYDMCFKVLYHNRWLSVSTQDKYVYQSYPHWGE